MILKQVIKIWNSKTSLDTLKYKYFLKVTIWHTYLLELDKIEILTIAGHGDKLQMQKILKEFRICYTLKRSKRFKKITLFTLASYTMIQTVDCSLKS